MKMHARKISGALTGRTSREGSGSPMEMRSLMDHSGKTVAGGTPQQQAQGKMSGESSGLSGDEVVDEGGRIVVGKI